MAKPDADFNGKAAAFEEDVYGSTKGAVRLAVLWEDLLSELPGLRRGGLHVLDAGGGAGHIAVRLAKLGNTVVLADPSEEMLAMAAGRAREEGVADAVRLVRSSIQEMDAALGERFDVITCHAVLEWLADPAAALAGLAPFLKPGGRLSLMFYNRNAAVLKRVLRGDFAGALEERPADAAAPVTLAERDVRGWLEEAGLTVESRAGIRIFHDHLPEGVARDRLEELLAVEKEFRAREPFASLAQHIHLVCRREGHA
jgi:S-adenosylmethionine-dependent methyltransferase